jgi:hypothetical protein
MRTLLARLRSASVRQRNGDEAPRNRSDPRRSASDHAEIDLNRVAIEQRRLRGRSNRTEIDA